MLISWHCPRARSESPCPQPLPQPHPCHKGFTHCLAWPYPKGESQRKRGRRGKGGGKQVLPDPLTSFPQNWPKGRSRKDPLASSQRNVEVTWCRGTCPHLGQGTWALSQWWLTHGVAMVNHNPLLAPLSSCAKWGLSLGPDLCWGQRAEGAGKWQADVCPSSTSEAERGVFLTDSYTSNNSNNPKNGQSLRPGCVGVPSEHSTCYNGSNPQEPGEAGPLSPILQIKKMSQEEQSYLPTVTSGRGRIRNQALLYPSQFHGNILTLKCLAVTSEKYKAKWSFVLIINFCQSEWLNS